VYHWACGKCVINFEGKHVEKSLIGGNRCGCLDNAEMDPRILNPIGQCMYYQA